MRIYYRNQRDFLISAIKKSPLDALVTIQEKDAGLHFLMKVDTSMSDEQLTQKAKEAGLVMTGAGATFPYGKDPKDSNIRIAPSYPTPEELAVAAEVFVLSVKLASVDKILETK